jgi:uncharacterized protein (DUF2141 family)
MKRISFLVLFTCVAVAGMAQASLAVEVELLKPDAGGMVRLALCRGEQAYTTVKGCHERSVPAGEKVVVDFEGLEPGEYAIKAFHDLNSNGEMDFNMLGIPREPYGFSNDARATFSPPAFKDAKFIVAPGANRTRLRM